MNLEQRTLSSLSYLVIADARRAQLLACQRLNTAGIGLRAVRTLENAHEAEHEHHRPSLGGGGERQGSPTRGSAHAGPHSIAQGHTAEEETERFAREIGRWLERAQGELGTARLVLFAPPRFLGLLRKHISTHGAPELREGDFARLDLNQLTVHPTVVAAMTEL